MRLVETPNKSFGGVKKTGMHELSIAQSILEIVHQSIPTQELRHVSSVRMKVGDLAGVIIDSLEFSFNALIAETPLANASLVIDRIPFTIHCTQCKRTSHTESGFSACPACGSIDTEILSGRELQVTSIELDDS